MRVSEAMVLAAACRKSLAFFVKTFWHIVNPSDKLIWNWHLDLVCESTQETYERIFAGLPKVGDSVLNVPPGTSKSTVKSIMAPSWAWTRMPGFCFLGYSYSDAVALDLGSKNRDVVKSELYQKLFPAVRIREDQDAKGNFKNTHGGLRYATGAKGSVTGLHFHVLGVDDPLDPNRAASEAELFHCNESLRTTVMQRKKDARISVLDLTMQRLHQDDPSSWMVETPGVRHICLPATLEGEVKPAHLADKYIDGLLDPIRLPIIVLNEKRLPQNLGEAGFAGQYLQSPVPAGGGLFKTNMIRWGVPPGKYKRIIRYWDNAASKTRRSAFTAGVKMAEALDGSIWVLDVRRGQWDSATREKIKRSTAEQDRHHVRIGQEEEPGSGGKDSTLLSTRTLKGFSFQVLRARGTKEVRADAFSAQVNNGNVWIPANFRRGNSWVGWAKAYIDELKHWPFSTFLDMGDASGGAYSLLARPKIYVGPVPKQTAGRR